MGLSQNTHISSVKLYQLSYQAPGSKVVGKVIQILGTSSLVNELNPPLRTQSREPIVSPTVVQCRNKKQQNPIYKISFLQTVTTMMWVDMATNHAGILATHGVLNEPVL